MTNLALAFIVGAIVMLVGIKVFMRWAFKHLVDGDTNVVFGLKRQEAGRCEAYLRQKGHHEAADALSKNAAKRYAAEDE